MRKVVFAAAMMLMCILLMMTVHAEQPQKITAGSFITFGSYEQDNDLTNGSEPIEWLVLEVEDGTALMISRYGLDSQPYNKDYVDTTWETCGLRAWLNGDFMNAAFSEAERDAIMTTDVDNSNDQGFDFTTIYGYAEEVTGGNNTNDKVFLLSYAEANRYFELTYKNDRNSAPRTAPTAYAKQKGVQTNTKTKTKDGYAAGWWWLRSPGTVQSYASRVAPDGSLSVELVWNAKVIVRPVIRINLKADIF